MIRALRQRHRVSMVILALTVPALFIAGLLARRPMPTATLPSVLSVPGHDSNRVLISQLKSTGSGLSLRIATLRPDPGSDRLRLSVQLTADPKLPELLVYWHAGSAPASAIEDDSYLLGTLIGTAPAMFQLPEQASTEPGSLIFFSLAQQAVVDSVALRQAEQAADAGDAS